MKAEALPIRPYANVAFRYKIYSSIPSNLQDPQTHPSFAEVAIEKVATGHLSVAADSVGAVEAITSIQRRVPTERFRIDPGLQSWLVADTLQPVAAAAVVVGTLPVEAVQTRPDLQIVAGIEVEVVSVPDS